MVALAGVFYTTIGEKRRGGHLECIFVPLGVGGCFTHPRDHDGVVDSWTWKSRETESSTMFQILPDEKESRDELLPPFLPPPPRC